MKILLCIILMFVITSCRSQKIIPPAVVQSSFSKTFPGITVKNWDKEATKYEAAFTRDDKQVTATFDAEGNLQETETDIPVQELPGAITSYIQFHYKSAKIKEAATIIRSNGEKLYEAEVKNKDLLFDVNGKFLNEEGDED